MPSFPRNIGLSVAVVDLFLLFEPHQRLKLINSVAYDASFPSESFQANANAPTAPTFLSNDSNQRFLCVTYGLSVSERYRSFNPLLNKTFL